MTGQPPDTDIWGRPMPRGPEPINTLLDGVLSSITTPGGRVMLTLAGEWESLAGPPWAGVSRPIGMKHGVLVIEVDDGSKATLLRFQQGALQQRLNRRFGEETVRDVKLRVRRHGGEPGGTSRSS